MGNAFAAQPIGIVLAEIDCRTGPDTVRRPDLSVLLRDRWHALDWNRIPLPAAPDIAIEIISPSESASVVQKKVWEYLSVGSREVWLLYLETKQLVLWTAQGASTLHGSDLLQTPLVPAFSIAVQDLFAVEW